MTAERSNSFGKALSLTLFISIVLVVVASYLLVLLMGYGLIFFTSEGVALSMQSVNFPVLLFFLIGFQTPVGVSASFSFIWIVYVLCFIVAWELRDSFHKVIGKSFSRSFRSLFSNFLFIMPLLSSMVLTAALAIVYSQEFGGFPTGQPSWPEGTPLQEMFLNVAYAPAVEELGFRIIPIGLFTVFSVFLAEKNVARSGLSLFVAAILYPDGAKRIAGLRNVSEHGIRHGVSAAEWTLILVTSIVFGFAHLTSGTGWESGKVTSVCVQGFFFALTYIAYGFEAPILLHWFFNYYLFFFDPDVVTKFFPTTAPILSLIELVILALGVLGWIAFAVAGLVRLLRRTRMKQESATPPTMLSS